MPIIVLFESMVFGFPQPTSSLMVWVSEWVIFHVHVFLTLHVPMHVITILVFQEKKEKKKDDKVDDNMAAFPGHQGRQHQCDRN